MWPPRIKVMANPEEHLPYGYWIDNNGKIIEVYNHFEHDEILAAIFLPDEPHPRILINRVLNEGWIRIAAIGKFLNNQYVKEMNVQGHRASIRKRWNDIYDIAIRHNVQSLYIEWMDGESSRISIEDAIEPPRMRVMANPLLVKKQSISEKTMQETTRKQYEENVAVVGPMGGMARMFGIHPNTWVAYFLIDPSDRRLVIDVVTGKSKGQIPIFAMAKSISGPGTIDMFWENPLTRKFAGAIQYTILSEKLVVTHIAVRKGWGRLGIATMLLDIIRSKHPDLELYAHDLTTEGKALFDRYRDYKVYTGLPAQEGAPPEEEDIDA